MSQRQPPKFITGPGSDALHEWQNTALVLVLQASIGCIGPDVLGMSVEADAEAITVHVCLREDNAQVDEDLDDLISDLEAQNAGIIIPPVDYRVVKYVGNTDPDWPGHHHRVLYLIAPRLRDDYDPDAD